MKKASKTTKRTTRRKSSAETGEEDGTNKKKTNKKTKEISEEESSVTAGGNKKKCATKRTVATASKGVTPEVEKVVEQFMLYSTEHTLDRLKDEFRMVNDIQPLPGTFERFNTYPTKNRYPDIPCLDRTRVSTVAADEKSSLEDYIHANKVVVDKAERVYVAAQGPKANTIEDFYKMIFAINAPAIVVLTPFIENGQNKCEEFWPMESGNYKTYGKLWVNNKKVEHQDQFSVYHLEILPEGCSNSSVTKLAHTTCWPEKSAASSGRSVLRMSKWLKTVENGPSVGPAVVVSSAGVGRAGTFIAIDAVISRLFKGIDTKVYEHVQSIRNQRALAVTNELQYLFIYSTILDYIRAKLTKYDDRVMKFFNAIKEL